ncbi:hypothetical protein R1flu_017381 [Riccia fluitans]|uniref:Uncharacterized protein n=1 Tax=Riccia fluitans TaxID=41844 RepID=A0ABD1ZCT7_9MARC
MANVQAPPLPLPPLHYNQEFMDLPPETRNVATHLVSVIWDLIERKGVPRSFTAAVDGDIENEPEQQRRRVEDDFPTPAQVAAAQVLMSKRTPMIILALLRSLWIGGTSAAHIPDAWILARLWRMIREYDMNGRVLSFHLDHRHEQEAMGRLGFEGCDSYLCSCWTKRLGADWHWKTPEQDMLPLPLPMIKTYVPDKLKRILTATLDEYVNNNHMMRRRNQWVGDKKRPYVWAYWMKPFLRHYLELSGIHNKEDGQFWYIADEDAELLGKLSGYTWQQIQIGLIEWREQNRNVNKQVNELKTQAPPPGASNMDPPGYRDPDEMFEIDKFVIHRKLGEKDRAITTIPLPLRNELMSRLPQLNSLDRKAKADIWHKWILLNPIPSRKTTSRGNKFIEAGEAHYNALAAAGGAPSIQACFDGQGEINPDLLAAAKQAAIKAADDFRKGKAKMFHEMRIRQGLLNKDGTPGPKAQSQLAAKDAIETLQNNYKINPPPTGDEKVSEVDAATPEEIYLILTGIVETQNADYCPASVLRLILNELRDPTVKQRITDNLQLIDYYPDVLYEEMLQDLWRFDLAPPNPSPLPGDGGDDDGGGGGGSGGGGDGSGGSGGGGDDNWGGSDWGGYGGDFGGDFNQTLVSLDSIFGGPPTHVAARVDVSFHRYAPVSLRGFSPAEYDGLLHYPQRHSWIFKLKELIAAAGGGKDHGAPAAGDGGGSPAKAGAVGGSSASGTKTRDPLAPIQNLEHPTATPASPKTAAPLSATAPLQKSGLPVRSSSSGLQKKSQIYKK